MAPLVRRLGKIWKTRTAGPEGADLDHVWRLHRPSAQQTEAATIVPSASAAGTVPLTEAQPAHSGVDLADGTCPRCPQALGHASRRLVSPIRGSRQSAGLHPTAHSSSRSSSCLKTLTTQKDDFEEETLLSAFPGCLDPQLTSISVTPDRQHEACPGVPRGFFFFFVSLSLSLKSIARGWGGGWGVQRAQSFSWGR